MTTAPTSAVAGIAALALLAVGALVAPLPVALATALLPAAVAALALARERRDARELETIRSYARTIRVERDRLVRPERTPPARTPEGYSLLARIDGVERLVGRAEADVQAAAEASERSQALRARFTAAMGHEIKTPLNAIVGFSTMLERRPPSELTAAQRESVVMIRRGAQELLRLLGDLLDSAKLDVGKLDLNVAFVPSVQVLTEAVKEAQAVVEPRPVRIEATLQPGLPPIRVDRLRLVQAIVAVLRHCARGLAQGTLALSAQKSRGAGNRLELHVEIHDPQRTLSPEELSRAFDPFRSPRTSDGGRPGGLGLALALARRLVRLHGGDVSATSEEGSGTRYVIAIPLED